MKCHFNNIREFYKVYSMEHCKIIKKKSKNVGHSKKYFVPFKKYLSSYDVVAVV